MYFLENEMAQYKKIILLVSNGIERKISSYPQLKKYYWNFLKEIQPDVPSPEWSAIARGSDLSPVFSPVFLRDTPSIQKMVEVFNSENALVDVQFKLEFDSETRCQREEVYQRFSSAIQKIHVLDPAFARVFDLVIQCLFFAPCPVAAGGTSSGAVGVIWIDSRKAWSEWDIIEFLVHETTHTLVFIDEWVYKHYVDVRRLVEPQSFAKSAILRKNRPLDKVLHALVVATEVVNWRNFHGVYSIQNTRVHPPSAIIEQGIAESIRSLHNNPITRDWVTPRFLEIVTWCEAHSKGNQAVA